MDSITNVHLEWRGPFRWFAMGDASIFDGPCAETIGVYVWAAPLAGRQRVFYVGQTEAGLAYRHHQHMQEYFSGAYSIYEATAFAEGRLDRLYKGYAYHQPHWKHAIPFYRRFPELLGSLVGHLRAMEVLIAPLPGPGRVQRRAETALMQAVYALPGEAGQMLEPGLRLEPRRNNEPPIAVKQSPAGWLEGVPEQFVA